MILNDLFESKMSEIDIEYQDFLNSRGKNSITDKEFQDAYGMTRTEWAKKNKEWTWQKERQPIAPDAHVMHEGDFEQDVEEGLRDPKDNPCWKGYKPVGTKQKGGRTVPNCVPKG